MKTYFIIIIAIMCRQVSFGQEDSTLNLYNLSILMTQNVERDTLSLNGRNYLVLKRQFSDLDIFISDNTSKNITDHDTMVFSVIKGFVIKKGDLFVFSDGFFFDPETIITVSVYNSETDQIELCLRYTNLKSQGYSVYQYDNVDSVREMYNLYGIGIDYSSINEVNFYHLFNLDFLKLKKNGGEYFKDHEKVWLHRRLL